MADDSDLSDDGLDDFVSGDEDPFSFRKHKFGGKEKQPRKSSTYGSGNDNDGSTSSSSSASISKPKGRENNKGATKKGGRRQKGMNTVDKKLELLSKRHVANGKKKRRRSSTYGDSCSSNSSSDEDKENRAKQIAKRVSQWNTADHSVLECISLSSDSSDADDDRPHPTLASDTSTTGRQTRTAARAAAAAAALNNGAGPRNKEFFLKDANKDTVEALQEARQAMEALKEAQKYHAEDMSFEVDEEGDDLLCLDDNVGTNSSMEAALLAASGAKTAETAAGRQIPISEAPTGRPICLTLRTIIVSSGKSMKPDGNEKMYKLRKGAKLRHLVDELRQSNATEIPETSHIKLVFDGQSLNLDRTPAFYDMEEGDLVDAMVGMPAAAGAAKVSASTASSRKGTAASLPQNVPALRAAHVKIKTRIKGGDPLKVREYQMRKSDPLRKLLDAYRQQHRESGTVQGTVSVRLEYSGRTLDLSSTPQAEGIVDNAMVEINDEIERQRQLQRISRAATTLPPPGQMMVKCRINGDDKKMQSYWILPADPFQLTLIDEFCSRNGVDSSECTFLFDGEQLRSNLTPQQLEMEGDEIIEVIVDKNVLDVATATLSGNSTAAVASAASDRTHAPLILASATSLQASTPAAQANAPSASAPYTSSSASDNRSSLGTASLQSTPSFVTGKTVISLQIMRNSNLIKPKKFRLYSTDSLEKLKEGYKKHYKKKGCKSVEFFFHGSKIENETASLDALGLRDMDTLVAMENKRKFFMS